LFLVLAGQKYDISESLNKATLDDLTQLKVKTGVGMKTLRLSLIAMGKLDDPEDFLDREDILLALSALVWLCRRRAGESKLTLTEAASVPVEDISFEMPDEDGAAEGEPDPT